MISKTVITLLSFAILCLYGFYYYRQCIKRARDMIRLYTGERDYERLRKY